jgi:hypothetical protein
MDRMSGSGVFARDADTIMTLTEHKEPDCYTVEMTLRNLPPQDAFVAEWKYPLMVVRDDLEPEDGAEEDKGLIKEQALLALIKDKPLRSGDWKAAAEEALGIKHADFHRIKGRLENAKMVHWDLRTKTWGATDGNGSSTPVSNVSIVSGETLDTTGTTASGNLDLSPEATNT